jgi:hypothetical protein
MIPPSWGGHVKVVAFKGGLHAFAGVGISIRKGIRIPIIIFKDPID